MTKNDYGYPFRKAFIAKNSDAHAVKVQALRDKMHAEGRALIGEEVTAMRLGWQIFKLPNRMKR